MEAQMQRQHGHEELNGSELHPDMQGEVGHHDHEHHEKKSVLTNVKEKAKKIKGKLSKHGHGHDHGHDHDHNGHDEEDDDDDNEEHIQDPEVHGAPMYESATIRSGARAGQQLGVNLEKPTTKADDRYDTSITDPPTKPFSQPEHEKSGQGQFGNTKHTSNVNEGKPRVKIGNPTEMEVVEEDPNAPKDRKEPSNYQSKVADPIKTGGAAAGITPILHSFEKMSVADEPRPQSKSDEPQKMFTGSHDQFLPEPIPKNAPVDSKDPGAPFKASPLGEKHGEKQTGNTGKISSAEPIPENAPVDSKDPGAPFKELASGEKHGEKQTGYTEKISSATSAATSALTEKAVAAKNVVASKLGYGEKERSGLSETGGGPGEQSGGGVGAMVADYGHRAAASVTETLAPVTEKVANVGSSMLSKVQGGGAKDQTSENKGVKNYFSEKLRPGEEDKALSEVILETLHLKKPEAEAEAEDKKKKKPEVEDKPVGKVTVSEEVESRLGIGKEGSKREKGGEDAPVEINANPAVMERVKGWFGMGQSQSPTKDHDGERRL